MVRVDVEGDALEEMPEVPDGRIHGKKLSIEGGVPLFCRGQLPAEEGDGGGALGGQLLQGGADGVVTSICQQLKAGVIGRKRK